MRFPKVSVITPSYNQGQFLEQTILSVVGQCYPNLEYIIMDGGSTDNSVELIKKYEGNLAHWESGPDGGQAAAINKAFNIATGDIVCWLNSDDMFTPGTLFRVADLLRDKTSPAVVIGECIRFYEDKSEKLLGSSVVSDFEQLELRLFDYIHQPSSFWTRQTIEAVGFLDDQLNYAFDWDWFIRAELLEAEFIPISAFLSMYRLHRQHKTGTGGESRFLELKNVYRKYNSEEELGAWLKYVTIKKYISRTRLLNRLLKWDKFMYRFFFRRHVSYDAYRSLKRMQ